MNSTLVVFASKQEFNLVYPQKSAVVASSTPLTIGSFDVAVCGVGLLEFATNLAYQLSQRKYARVIMVGVCGAYPGRELIAVKIFGRDIGIMDKLKKSEPAGKEEKPEEEKEEKEETSLSKRLEEISAKAEKAVNAADYVYRVLTGRCGRRAWSKVKRRLISILDHILPNYWKIMGTVGLVDPCLNGRLTGITAMLMPFADDHLRLNTEWEMYRCDMEAEMSGKLRLIVPVKEAVSLFFDRDCRKVFKKLLKVRAKLQ